MNPLYVELLHGGVGNLIKLDLRSASRGKYDSKRWVSFFPRLFRGRIEEDF